VKKLKTLISRLKDLYESNPSSLEVFQTACKMKQEADEIFKSYTYFYDNDFITEISEQENTEYIELCALYHFFNETLKEVLILSMSE
jgi:hypothetical protein